MDKKEIKIENLQAYHKNPRKITTDDFKNLEKWLLELGDISGIVFNKRTGEVLGGNMRTRIFKAKGARIVVTEAFPKPDSQGTTALGYVVLDNKKYAFREVDWDEKTSEKANIVANKAGGSWDYEVLANEWEAKELVDWGFAPVEVSFANVEVDTGKDKSDLENSMDSYLNGTIKQIVLYFGNEEYENVLGRLKILIEKEKAESHTDIFIKMLNYFETK